MVQVAISPPRVPSKFKHDTKLKKLKATRPRLRRANGLLLLYLSSAILIGLGFRLGVH